MQSVATTQSTPIDVSPLTPETQSHHVQLDAIRAIAVMLVMVEHYFPGTERWMEVGSAAVRVFFVLSGFLITGILLRARDDAEADHSSKPLVLRNFYIRRFLHIFPLFYGVLFATYLIGIPQVRQTFFWHLTYTSNFLFFIHGDSSDSVSHFWSLAVEEQFYLVWPFLILFVPRKWTGPLVLLSIVVGVLFRLAMFLGGGNYATITMLMPACLDSLGAGALLALLYHDNAQQLKKSILNFSLWAGLILFALTFAGGILYPSLFWLVTFGFSVALWSIWLIDRAYSGFGGWTGKIFSFPPLTYMGIISYGIYVMHNLVGGVTTRLLHHLHVNSESIYNRGLCMFLITLALASASWQFFEKPINQLKHRFPYRLPTRVSLASA